MQRVLVVYDRSGDWWLFAGCLLSFHCASPLWGRFYSIFGCCVLPQCVLRLVCNHVSTNKGLLNFSIETIVVAAAIIGIATLSLLTESLQSLYLHRVGICSRSIVFTLKGLTQLLMQSHTEVSQCLPQLEEHWTLTLSLLCLLHLLPNLFFFSASVLSIQNLCLFHYQLRMNRYRRGRGPFLRNSVEKLYLQKEAKAGQRLRVAAHCAEVNSRPRPLFLLPYLKSWQGMRNT